VLVKMRVTRLIKQTDNLVTCSKYQYDWMLKSFVKKSIFYHNFPTLVTDIIKNGEMTVPELTDIDNYVLFFGQVEQYKGVDILYNAFINDTTNTSKRHLVIAGKGHIYFERNVQKESNVLFINRYIDDEEIKSLFTNAFCVVFPYISGTQSGILSIPYYFKVPSLVSDIPFFKELIVDNVTSISFNNDEPASIIQKINDLDASTSETLKINAFAFYQQIYDREALKHQLQSAYAASYSAQKQLT